MSEIIYLSNARLSFPTLVEPKASVANGPLKYSADLIVDQATMATIMQKVGEVAAEKWKEHAAAVLQLIQGDRKQRCYGNGNERIDKKTFKPYLGYEGMYYCSANNDDRPQMIALDGKPVDPSNTMASLALARKLYGGCYVNAAIDLWAQDNKHGRAIRAKLIAVQFLKDGEAFGEGAADVSNLFGAVAAPTGPTAGGMDAPAGLPAWM